MHPAGCCGRAVYKEKVVPDIAPMRMLYVQYANPGAFPPVQHSARCVGEQGHRVLVLGVCSEDTAQLTFDAGSNIQLRLSKTSPPGLRQKLEFAAFHVRVVLVTVCWRSDWVYINDALATPSGWLISVLRLARVIYHEHDSPYESRAGASNVSYFMRFILAARRECARRAKCCVLPNGRRASQLKLDTATERPVFEVWNCPSLAEVSAVDLRHSREGLVVFFHGSIVPQRLPLSVIDAVAECSAAVELRFAGYETIGHRGYIRALLARAEELGVSDRVNYLGPLRRRKLLQKCAEADIGLALMPMQGDDLNMQAMVGASNKPFDYLLCGLPLLVSRLPEWEDAFVEAGFARACMPDDPRSIAAGLQWYLDHAADRKRMGAAGRDRIVDLWNYETQFRPVLDFISDSSGGAPVSHDNTPRV